MSGDAGQHPAFAAEPKTNSAVNYMSKPIEDGQIFESGGVEYLYDEGEIIEIADSYPSVDAALAALRSRG